MTTTHIQKILGHGAPYWLDPLQAWSAGMAQPWGLVLGMSLPIISRVDFRVRSREGIFRACDLPLAGISGVLLQRRVRQDESSPWFWVAHTSIAHGRPNPAEAFPHFLDLLADRFRRLEGRSIQRAIPDERLAGALSGQVWALLSGNLKAVEILDLNSRQEPGV